MIKYNVVARTNPIDKSIKYYAQAISPTQVTFDQLCEEISHSTTATEADASAVIKESLVHLLSHLLDGKSVSFGNLGSFRVTLKSKGADTADAFTADNIENVMVRWSRPTKLRRELKPGVGSVRFKKASA